MAHMGPPPSPKEPRRSGRRSIPSASSSKSPAPSPISESAPRPKDTCRTPSSSSSRSKRSKQEDIDEALHEQLKIAPPPTSGRNKRKGKDRDKQSDTSLDHHHPQKSLTTPSEVSTAGGAEDEEQGITRCICGSAEDDPDAGEFMVQCETCKVWQHGLCMGFTSEDQLLGDDDYYCEQCRPDMHQDLLKKLVKRVRHTSATSHHSSIHAPNNSRSPRSHSPVLSKPQKRRNTMNSRDAAYDESVVKALMEATAVEATSGITIPPQILMKGHDDEGEDDLDTGLGNRRKRKRTDDESISRKRTRSASATSDRPIMSNLSRDEPVSTNGSKATPTPTGPPRPRQKRGGGRKSTQVAESVASVEVDEAAPPKRQSRGKGVQDSRRSQASGPKVDTTSTSHPRAHHNSHAYAVAQQPLYTSWNLPDYLAHLENMLPTDVPRPLEVQASGKDLADVSIERGVKVKWPSKRTSIGDMNKRVRSLMEWVGREQAGALERGRRKDALIKVLRDSKRKQDPLEGETAMILDDTTSFVESPMQEKPTPVGVDDLVQSTTAKLMEEVMEELINFQERFGPGSKSKERERRVVS